MPREIRTFLIATSILATVIGFAAGDRRDPFSLSAAAITVAVILGLVALARTHRPTSGRTPASTSQVDQAMVVGAAAMHPMTMAYQVGARNGRGDGCPWILIIAQAGEIAPVFKPAVLNACHHAFEMGKAVRRGKHTEEEAMKLCGVELSRQINHVQQTGRSLPPLRTDPRAPLAPTPDEP